VVAEGIQTVLRREGYPKPYEALLALTRTHTAIDQAAIVAFIDTLDVAEPLKRNCWRLRRKLYRHSGLSKHAQTLPERIRARPCRQAGLHRLPGGHSARSLSGYHHRHQIPGPPRRPDHLLHNMPNRFANQKLINQLEQRLPATDMVRISPEMDFYDAVLNHRDASCSRSFSGTPISD
jgi:hypothetical protein